MCEQKRQIGRHEKKHAGGKADRMAREGKTERMALAEMHERKRLIGRYGQEKSGRYERGRKECMRTTGKKIRT